MFENVSRETFGEIAEDPLSPPAILDFLKNHMLFYA